MPALPAADAVRAFTLAAPPPGFIDDPYPVLRGAAHAQPGARAGARQRAADALRRRARRSTAARQVSSDKQREFAPKLGAGTPLYEHHTTSLVFSDPPLHTRVRRILMGALNQRAIARMEAGLVTLVEACSTAWPTSRRPT
jgi:cytochrome P450